MSGISFQANTQVTKGRFFGPYLKETYINNIKHTDNGNNLAMSVDVHGTNVSVRSGSLDIENEDAK